MIIITIIITYQSLDFLVVLCLTNSKNWTSCWTVLQGSQLIFAKAQAMATSWVSDNLTFANLECVCIWTCICSFSVWEPPVKARIQCRFEGSNCREGIQRQIQQEACFRGKKDCINRWMNYLFPKTLDFHCYCQKNSITSGGLSITEDDTEPHNTSTYEPFNKC